MKWKKILTEVVKIAGWVVAAAQLIIENMAANS